MNPNEENLKSSPHHPDGMELMCSGILATEFGRKESHALRKAVAQLVAEESRKPHWLQKIRAGWRPLPQFPRFAIVAALVFIAGISIWSIFSNYSSSSPKRQIASVSGQLNAQWANDQFKDGDMLMAGDFELKSGVVELMFHSKARVAVEGPAEFRLSDALSIELHSGKLSADVPPPAHGFTVKTPNATIVDLGTRFGVNVGNDATKLDVFEGKVVLTPPGKSGQLLTQHEARMIDANGTPEPAVFSETFYPALSTTVVVHPVNCGFDGPGNLSQGGLPHGFNYWRGPACVFSAAQQGITPLEGRGMLQFNSSGPGKDSEVWQLMDLRPRQAMLRRGNVKISTTTWFNRIHGAAGTAKKFGLTIAAFKGNPKDADELWRHRNERALAMTDKELISDDDPATWEKVEVSMILPSDADFLLIRIRAIAPGNGTANPFPGHFTDLIDCSFSEPLRAGLSNDN